MRTAQIIPFRPRPRPAPPVARFGLLWWAASIHLARLSLAAVLAPSKKED